MIELFGLLTGWFCLGSLAWCMKMTVLLCKLIWYLGTWPVYLIGWLIKDRFKKS